MDFSERLKEQRQAHNLTQQQVADEIGVAVSTYAHYESGRRMPDIKRLQKLCHIFHIAIGDHFPIVRTITYEPELIGYLTGTKELIEKEFELLQDKYDSLSNRDLFIAIQDMSTRLKEAIDPVQRVWENTMDIPEMDLTGLEPNQITASVKYRFGDWVLLRQSLNLRSTLLDFATKVANRN